VINQQKLTDKVNFRLDKYRVHHLAMILASLIVTSICIIVPLVLQGQFADTMKEAQDLRELTHLGTMTRYYDEVLTMSARMTALTAGQEMIDPALRNSTEGRRDRLLSNYNVNNITTLA